MLDGFGKGYEGWSYFPFSTGVMFTTPNQVMGAASHPQCLCICSDFSVSVVLTAAAEKGPSEPNG